jgi:hypothetical protein
MTDLPDDVRYRLQNKADKGKVLAVLIGIFASPFAYLYAKDTSSLDGWGWFAFNLFTLNYLLFGFIIVPIHVYYDIRSAQKRLKRAESNTSYSSNKSSPFENRRKRCPDCAEQVKLRAKVCKHCGHEWTEEEVRKELQTAVEQTSEMLVHCSRTDKIVSPEGIMCPECGGGYEDEDHAPASEYFQ